MVFVCVCKWVLPRRAGGLCAWVLIWRGWARKSGLVWSGFLVLLSLKLFCQMPDPLLLVCRPFTSAQLEPPPGHFQPVPASSGAVLNHSEPELHEILLVDGINKQLCRPNSRPNSAVPLLAYPRHHWMEWFFFWFFFGFLGCADVRIVRLFPGAESRPKCGWTSDLLPI